MTREEIAEDYPNVLFADGFDDALLGIADRKCSETVAAYDVDKIIQILMKDGMNYEEAREYFDYNIADAYVGEHTPVFITLNL